MLSSRSTTKSVSNSSEMVHVGVIGGGVGGTEFTWFTLHKMLKNDSLVRARVFVVDKSLFKPYPWSIDSSPLPLLQHQDFSEMGPKFMDWVADNRIEIIEFIKANSAGLSQKWLKETEDFVLTGTIAQFKAEWTKRFPRAVFGKFLDVLRHETLELAKQSDVEIVAIGGEVIETNQLEDGSFKVQMGSNLKYFATTATPDGFADVVETENALLKSSSFIAKQLFISTGMPPAPDIAQVVDAKAYLGTTEKDGKNRFVTLLDLINEQCLKKNSKPVEIRIVGLGPAALDVLFWLDMNCLADPSLKKKIKVKVISTVTSPRPAAVESGKTPKFNPKFKDYYNTAQELENALDEAYQFGIASGYTEGEVRKTLLEGLRSLFRNKQQPEAVVKAFSGRNYAPKYLGKLSSDAALSFDAIESLKKMKLLKIEEGRLDMESVCETKDSEIGFAYSSGKNGPTMHDNADIFINCIHDVVGLYRRQVEETWLGKVLNQPNVFTAGLGAYFKEGYQLKPMTMDPQAPAIINAAEDAAETVVKNLFEKAGPVEFSAGGANKEQVELVVENVTNFLSDNGLTIRDFRQWLWRDFNCEYYVHETLPIVLRIEFLRKEQNAKIPEHPAVMQSLRMRDFTQELNAKKALFRGLRVSLLPKFEISNIRESDLGSLMGIMRKAGYELEGNDPRNIGFFEGKPFIINPGAIITQDEYKISMQKLKSITDQYMKNETTGRKILLDQAINQLFLDSQWGVNADSKKVPPMNESFWGVARFCTLHQNGKTPNNREISYEKAMLDRLYGQVQLPNAGKLSEVHVPAALIFQSGGWGCQIV